MPLSFSRAPYAAQLQLHDVLLLTLLKNAYHVLHNVAGIPHCTLLNKRKRTFFFLRLVTQKDTS